MTSHLAIETISDDNQKSLFRSQRLKLSGKEVITPLRALDSSKFRSDVSINKDAFGFNEIYRTLGSDKISLLQKNTLEHDRFSRDLQNMSKRGMSTDLALCLVKYSTAKANPFPNTKEIELLTDVSHSFSDITPLPLLDVKIDASNFSSYLDCMNSCYDVIEELNNKPIMGILPNIPRELYPKLLDYYLGKGINSFCFDFNGQTPDHLKLRPILRYLKNKKILDKTLVYGVNAKPGRALKNANVIPSKDFIAYGFGLDVLGESHVGMKLPKAFLEKMKKAIDQQQQNKKRIFIKSDYGYYRTNSKKDVVDVFPSDTKITIDKILDDDQKTYQKLFNMEQQALEAGEIKKRLGELGSKGTILDYVRGKTQIQKEIRHLESGPKSIS